MLEQLRSYLQFGNQFCGIEHCQKDGNNSIMVSVLKKSKQELNLQDFFEVHSIENLKEKLPQKQHVFLVINDGNVLTKKVESSQIDNIKLVNKAFPNINIEDFHFEILHQGKDHFVFICRKDYTDRLINEYKELGFSVLNVSLGNSLVSTIADYIDSNEIQTSNRLIKYDEGIITSIDQDLDSQIKEYDFNGLKTNSNQILSLVGALNSVLQNHDSSSNFEGKKQLLMEDYNHRRFFNLFIKFALVFIFGLLLINFFFFNHYFGKVNDLQQLSQINQSSKTRLINLKDKVGKTEKLVNDILKSNSSKSSFYINKIIQSLPSSILLNELDYQPLMKRIKDGQVVEVDRNTIVVSGESNNSNAYSNWIAKLESEPWVKEVKTILYSNKPKSLANFSIEIILRNE